MKKITLTRRELYWETRENTWTEEDWIKLLNWAKDVQNSECNYSYWTKKVQAFYKNCKDLTWDEVVEDFDQYQYVSNKDSIHWEFQVEREGREPDVYTEYLGEFILDYMREDNFELDPISVDYADDYEEQLFVDKR